MSEDLCYMDATALAEMISARRVSPVEVLDAHLKRADNINPKLNAIVTSIAEAGSQAREAEEAVMRGDALGPLHGVPVTIKDCIDTAGVRTTRGSKIFSDLVPDRDATVVARLKGAGAIPFAKTNMPEFALWWETDNAVFGRTENPWMSGRTPGGSSGGEAAAIAAGLSPLGMGSDVGGSIREPANYCGIVGLKATHGRIPLTGHWPDTLLRFMHVGPMARTVRDIALSMAVLSGPDGRDAYAAHVPVPDGFDLGSSIAGMRVGWCAGGPFSPVDAEVRETVGRAAAALEELGCQVEAVPLPVFEDPSPQDLSLIIYAVEGGHYLDPVIRGKEDELGPWITRRLGVAAPSQQEHLEATAAVDVIRAEFLRFFSDHDLLLCPSGPFPAHPHDAAEIDVAGGKVPGRNALRATIPFDLTGSPAVSVPFGWSGDGLPIGVQIVGRHFEEATVLRVASRLEQLHDSGTRRPPV